MIGVDIAGVDNAGADNPGVENAGVENVVPSIKGETAVHGWPPEKHVGKRTPTPLQSLPLRTSALTVAPTPSLSRKN